MDIVCLSVCLSIYLSNYHLCSYPLVYLRICLPQVPSTKDGIKEQLESYLKNPPVGIDPLLWDQAKKDNPDPDQLIPG